MNPLITKSKYINGVQCPAYLWLQINNPTKIPPFNDLAKHNMEQGTLVGELATKLFPQGIKVPEEFKENLTETQKLLKKRKPLFEAGFKFKTPEGEIYARIDILRPAGKGAWDIIEVKSGTKVKDINLHDVSFQKYVCEKSGLKINNCILCHVNNEYVKGGEIDVEKLFVLEDVDDAVGELYDCVEDKIKELFGVIALKDCPAVTKEDLLTAEYSNVLFDEFYDSLPEASVFELYGLWTKKKLALYEKGIIEIKDLPADFKLNEKHKIQKKCANCGEQYVDEREIKGFLKKLKYPLYYLDFETFSTVVPKFDGTKPYQAIPFQFSIHVVKKKGGKAEHVSFLAEGDEDPRLAFMNSLKENLGDRGSVVVYNESFEKKILKGCSEALPEFEGWCKGILDRIVDLLHPFKKFHFYHPKQKGSASIKKVLPIFSKDVNYGDLVISNGEDASLTYLKSHILGEGTGKEKAEIRKNLERYCELDTWAEIVLVEGLGKVCGGK